MARNNPILKTLKENDIVLISVPSWNRTDLKQIVKLNQIEFQPSTEEFNFDWIDFDGEVLYTNVRMNLENQNFIFGNCLAICEKVNPDFMEQTAKIHDLWKAGENVMSEEEYQYEINRTTTRINFTV